MSIKQSNNAASKTSALWRGHTVGMCRTLTALDVCCITTTGSSVLLRRRRDNSACKRRRNAQQKTSGSDRTRRRGVKDNSAEFQTSIFTIMCFSQRSKRKKNPQEWAAALSHREKRQQSKYWYEVAERKEKTTPGKSTLANNIVGATLPARARSKWSNSSAKLHWVRPQNLRKRKTVQTTKKKQKAFEQLPWATPQWGQAQLQHPLLAHSRTARKVASP